MTAAVVPDVHVVQSLVFPGLDLPGDERLYIRTDRGAWARLREPRLDFADGGTATTDTFYGGLTVAAWRGRCDIGSMALALEGDGEFVVAFGLHRIGQTSVWLDEAEVRLTAGQLLQVPIEAWPRLTDGLLYARLRAHGAAVLRRGAYVTLEAPRRVVRLGIVITHFNRQAQVLPAIERIGRTVLDRPDLQGRITLTVVDNSRNLELPPRAGVERLDNRNLGGTGGFVRGLLRLIDGGAHTHALFMDDDASCEGEAIARTHALLGYARDDELAVAGALVREAAPWQLLEKGARFDGQVRPLHGGLDLREVPALLEAERERQAPGYGAWWFFAFALPAVKRFPFPFFVRGDDIHFGLANRFRIATLNGVACLGDDFGVKHGPLTAYLDARYHVVLALLEPGRIAPKLGWVAGKLFQKSLASYHYSSARAVTLALRHVLEGPAFFKTHLDLQAVRSEIGGWLPAEKLLPIDRTGLALRGTRRSREPRWRTWLRALTLQGFLLPGVLLRNRTTLQEKNFHGQAAAVFRFRHVLYEHTPTATGYLAHFDRPRFFAELRAFARTFAEVLRRAPELRRAYRDGAEELTSAGFWRGVYGLPGAAAGGQGGVSVGAPASAPVGEPPTAQGDARRIDPVGEPVAPTAAVAARPEAMAPAGNGEPRGR